MLAGYSEEGVKTLDEVALSNLITEVLMFEELPASVQTLRNFIEHSLGTVLLKDLTQNIKQEVCQNRRKLSAQSPVDTVSNNTFFNTQKGRTEKFRKRNDIPDLSVKRKPTRNTILNFINSQNVRLAVEPEPTSLYDNKKVRSEAKGPSLAKEIENSNPV